MQKDENFLSANEAGFFLQDVGKVYLKARQQKAHKLFGESYLSLSEEKGEVVDLAVPIWFSFGNVSISKPPPLLISIEKNGEILLGGFKCSIENLEEKLIKANKNLKETYERVGYEYPLVTSLKVEVGATDSQVNEVKDILRKTNVQQINYSSEDMKPE